MLEITTAQLVDWIEKAQIQGISPDTLIISMPDTPQIKICGTEISITARPLIYTVMGIEIYIDASLSKDIAYLIDRKSIVEVDNLGPRE